MATVVARLSMSLDGFIADPSGAVGPLFDWYGNGEETVEWPGAGHMVSRTSAASAQNLRETIDAAGALVAGRRVFDYTQGWNGSHPLDVPVFVVTHSVPEGWPRADAPFTFVTTGVADAVAEASAAAGDKVVGVNGPKVAQQCLELGLLHEIHVDLVPVLLGEGIPFFDHVHHGPVLLTDPQVTEGQRVTHLRYRVA